MAQPILPVLALIMGTLSIPAEAQLRFVADERLQETPTGVAPTVLPATDSALASQMIPGAVTVTTVETTEEDENGNTIQTSYETRIEPVAAVAYAPQIQPAIYQPATYTPAATALFTAPSAPSLMPAPHLDVDLAALLIPDLGQIGKPQVLRIARDRDTGHFIAPIRINGVDVRAIVDTGAQETILSARDARLTGANRDVVSSEPMAGIGGYTTLDVTRVRSMEVAGQQLGGFTAAIGQEGIPFTLLGQTEIARLGRIEIENGVMTITPRQALLASR